MYNRPDTYVRMMSTSVSAHGMVLRQLRRPLTVAVLLYLLFVVYGSLIPFQWRGLSWAQAWQAFLHIPYLELGADSRADWVANIVLYVPLAFLGSAWFAAVDEYASPLFRTVMVWTGCIVIAVAVEFAQVNFPPRTVSLNDLLAEGIGSTMGVALWVTAGPRIVALSAEVLRGGPKLFSAAAALYALAYMLVSLFPYDFVVSRVELLTKFQSSRYGLLVADCDGLRCVAKHMVEMLAVIPLGAWLGMLWGRSSPGLALRGAAMGGALGLLIEGAQLLLVSGVSEGLSVVARAVGVAAGATMYQHLHAVPWPAVRRWLRPVVLISLVPYAVLLARASGWFSQHALGSAAAIQRLRDISFIPLYYHYYTTETAALVSLLANIALYLPVGCVWVAWRTGARWPWVTPPSIAAAGMLGALAALFAESGKLFLSLKHPDPTNVLIGAAAAALGCWMVRAVVQGPRASPQMQISMPEPDTVESGKLRRLCALGLIVLTVVIAGQYPLGSGWLILGLTLYGVVLLRWPQFWLFAVPALLPVLDLAPWSGWLLVDEMDLVVFVTLALSLWRGSIGWDGLRRVGLPVWALAGVALSYAISMIVGLIPMQIPDANALYSYHTHYNSLRIAKGFFWALGLALLLPQAMQSEGAVRRYFLPGLYAGLAVVIAVALWQRHVFVGLDDVSSDFRVTATFSGMHVGGAYIEAYLVLVLPVVLWWLLTASRWSARLAALVLLSSGVYVLGVTYSRGGYLGFAVALAVLGMLYLSRRQSAIRVRTILVGALAVAMAGVVTVPILLGSYAQSRSARIGPDMETRLNHWREVWSMMDRTLSTQLWGMGLGRFPQVYLWEHPEGSGPATFRYVSEGDNTFLRLGSGDALYLGQRVALSPGQVYRLSLDIRSRSPAAVIEVPICEKALLYSFRCIESRVEVNTAQGGWEHHELEITVPMGDMARPMELALYNPLRAGVMDVDNVSVRDVQGGEHIANGDFTHAGARWFFTTDYHLAWHEKNLYLHLLFEQGWIGLGAFIALVGTVYVRRLRAPGVDQDVAILAALAGVFVIGVFDSLVDSPRLAMLLYLSLMLAAVRKESA